ncbi:hypothetical protein Y032_0004g1874 [Ancylostoma ceylanicum]|uniref:Uncharacterized protein n=1 Tax=Ancylostoma ceylanicum TaxID=53326 RepID=A0A016VU80_9BILA|nr:hypothetical protein Y032_0004g1874 [Ancylostoma ceylanicum]
MDRVDDGLLASGQCRSHRVGSNEHADSSTMGASGLTGSSCAGCPPACLPACLLSGPAAPAGSYGGCAGGGSAEL